jgi:uncharacterized membrane protein
MEKEITLKVGKNNLIGKLIAILIISLLFGYFMTKNFEKEYERGKNLTKAAYLQNYDHYKGQLMERSRNLAGNIIGVYILCLLFFGAYELFSKVVVIVLNKSSRPRKNLNDNEYKSS